MHPSKLVLALLLAIGVSVSSTSSPAGAASGSVNVFYAASLLHLNESVIGPAFQQHTGIGYQGKAAGSVAIANQVKDHLAMPDVIELADPAVNRMLMGSANGDYVSWYFTFARSRLVVGFDPNGRFASSFRAVQHHTIPWYQAMEKSGLRLGRTDPALDPKGYRTLFMAHLAERVFHLRRFTQRVFGSDENPSQIFPEEVLVSRLLTGQLDAGIFYLSEVRALHIPYVALPAKIDLGSTRYTKLYATQSYTTPQGATITGAPILYTLTIPHNAVNQAQAERFVQYVLGKQGRILAGKQGLLPAKIVLHGKRQAVPVRLLSYIGKT